jgi:uncharacterized protein (TIGR03083 family)
MPTREPAALDHLAELVRMQDAFLATIPEVDPHTPVPWCGSWEVRDLVEHLAGIHHWAAAQARDVAETPLGDGPFDLEVLYRDCAAELRAALRSLAPDAVGSTLLGRGPATFWRRRQLHETLVHLWDLRAAAGLSLEVEARVWADTVEEVVTVMQPRQVRLGRMPPLSQPIELVASDVEGRWRLDSDASTDRPAAARVEGPAASLALLLWGRTSPDDSALQSTGDRSLLDDALAQPLTP